MPIEIELKLKINPEDIKDLQHHSIIAQYAITAKNTQHLLNTYYDTVDYALRQQGIGLRIREINGHCFQTLKWAGQKIEGLSHREEWEQEIPNANLDYALIPDPTLRQFLKEKILATQLLPLFKTDFHRTFWLLQITADTQIELAIDQGIIQAGTLIEPICELELELKAGNKEQLLNTALLLQKQFSFPVEETSKAARGYKLHEQAVAKRTT